MLELIEQAEAAVDEIIDVVGRASYLNNLWKLNFCDYPMTGDVNGDCVFNFVDFPIMAPHWLEEAWYN